MKVHKIIRKQRFGLPVEKVWDFFSSPHNLSKITPSYMDFKVKNELPEKMYSGMIIEYRVRPFANIPMTWVTEITQFAKPYYFIDEQRIGPYSFWHHQHHFNPIEGGTEVSDLVHYKLPFGFLGRIVHSMFIESQLKGIFNHRFEVLNRLLTEEYLSKQAIP